MQILFICIGLNSLAQNVGIGTTSLAGRLHVKGNTDSSQLVIDAHSTQLNTRPLIKLRNSAGKDLLWIHSDDTTNTFIGLNAGRVNNANGITQDGINNAFIGNGAGYSNSLGSYNTANGYRALYTNSTGYYNTASGHQALYYNSTGNYNTAMGFNALGNTTAANYNVAVGFSAGDSYNNGFNNVFVGANTDVF